MARARKNELRRAQLAELRLDPLSLGVAMIELHADGAAAPRERGEAFGCSWGGLSNRLQRPIAGECTAPIIGLAPGFGARRVSSSRSSVTAQSGLGRPRAESGPCQSQRPDVTSGSRAGLAPSTPRHPATENLIGSCLHQRCSQRNDHEYLLSRLDCCLQISSRNDKLAVVFLSFVHLPLIWEARQLL